MALLFIRHVNIDWIEQPVIADDIDAMAHIRSKTDLPLMIDEGLKSSREMRQIIKLDAADKVNIKLMKCGGIYPAVKLAHQAEMAGIECQVDLWSNHPLPLPQDSMSLSRKNHYERRANRSIKVHERHRKLTLRRTIYSLKRKARTRH